MGWLRRQRRIFLRLVLLVLPFALFFSFLGIQEYGFGNVHAVIAGKIYRSAQPGAGDIARYKREYQIQSVLNLRGAKPGAPWYDAEAAEAATQGITLLNFKMSAGRELTNKEAFSLIAMMRSAPKPLLIHCRSGSDRTGLAAALYVTTIAKLGADVGGRQLSMRYGHMPLGFNFSAAMDRTFERMIPYLDSPKS